MLLLQVPRVPCRNYPPFNLKVAFKKAIEGAVLFQILAELYGWTRQHCHMQTGSRNTQYFATVSTS
jgi:hypothetical protein